MIDEGVEKLFPKMINKVMLVLPFLIPPVHNELIKVCSKLIISELSRGEKTKKYLMWCKSESLKNIEKTILS
jgi:hypothetical protein